MPGLPVSVCVCVCLCVCVCVWMRFTETAALATLYSLNTTSLSHNVLFSSLSHLQGTEGRTVILLKQVIPPIWLLQQ